MKIVVICWLHSTIIIYMYVLARIHGNKTIQNLPNLVAPIKYDLHDRLVIICAIKIDPGLINMISLLHNKIK